MKKQAYHDELKAIKLLQDRSQQISDAHDSIGTDIDFIKKQLALLGGHEAALSPEFESLKAKELEKMQGGHSLAHTSLSEIYKQANERYDEAIGLNEILGSQDRLEIEKDIDKRIENFNQRYGLDDWDYAIAGSCGLFAAMLDLLCVKAPPSPNTKWTQEVDGIFNQWTQKAFNKALPSDISELLSQKNPIGAPDSSVISDLIDAPEKALNPTNHRLRSLAHDPILGFIFGVIDMKNGTCTTVINGKITSILSKKGPTDGNIFQLLGRMFGHLLSDINAPSSKGNRGMGLPAPFMGILRMFENIPIGDSNFGKQIEWMYINGYDFRQFIATSIPVAIMEVLLRCFYTAKQMKIYSKSFGETIVETIPTKMNPRFRIMLALAYGTSSSVNAGKMYVTQNILNASYASWMGLAWNGFHALKWALLERHLKLWSEIEEAEIRNLETTVNHLEQMQIRAINLPTQ